VSPQLIGVVSQGGRPTRRRWWAGWRGPGTSCPRPTSINWGLLQALPWRCSLVEMSALRNTIRDRWSIVCRRKSVCSHTFYWMTHGVAC